MPPTPTDPGTRHRIRLMVPVRHAFGPCMLLRTLLDALATVSYLISRFHLPIATATVINMATPLVIALPSGPVLRKRGGVWEIQTPSSSPTDPG